MNQAQESNLGNDVTSYVEGDLTRAITKINEVNESYRAAYKNLESYFENDLKDAVQGDTYNAFKTAFDQRKAHLSAVNDYLDNELLPALIAGNNEGGSLADDLYGRIQSHNN